MGYYDVLEEIERLHKAGFNKVTARELANNLNQHERGIKRCIAQLVSEGVINRVVISDKKREVYYSVKKGGKQEEFINGVFKVIVDIIR